MDEDIEGIGNYDSENSSHWIGIFMFVGLLIGVIVIFSNLGSNSNYEGQSSEEWFDEYNQCSFDLENYQIAFEEANVQIEEANSNIEEANRNIDEANAKIERAKNSSYGGDYNDMQYQLDNLKTVDSINTVDTVAEP